MLHSDMSLLITVFYDIGTNAYPAVAMPPKGTPKEVERSTKMRREIGTKSQTGRKGELVRSVYRLD